MKFLRKLDALDEAEQWQEFERQCREDNLAHRPEHPILGLIAFVVVSIAVVIAAAIMLAAAEWSPGAQDQIAQSYRARQHAAVSGEVATR